MYLNSDVDNFNKSYLKSAMCFTKFYDLNLVQFASLAQVAYETNIATDKIKAYLSMDLVILKYQKLNGLVKKMQSY